MVWAHDILKGGPARTVSNRSVRAFGALGKGKGIRISEIIQV